MESAGASVCVVQATFSAATAAQNEPQEIVVNNDVGAVLQF